MAGIFRKSLIRQESGVVAVEFAMIGIPFFMLLIGIVETGLFFAAGVVLEGASAEASRLIRTGQLQDTANPEDAFAAELCERVGVMIPCPEIQYEVIRVDPNTFANADDYQSQFDADGNLISQGFDAGDENDVILVRSAYKYDFLTPFLGSLMTGSPDRTWMVHVSTVVVKNEPFRFGGG